MISTYKKKYINIKFWCPFVYEIRMEGTFIGKLSVEMQKYSYLIDFVVKLQ